MSGPCDDLRVIDLSSGPAGGVATMVLADFGADVIKIERPGGDPLRRLPSAPMWLRGKRSAVLDLDRRDGDRGRLHELAAGADVLVASFRPGRAEALGADHATLSAINPQLVYCSITGWGPRGQYAQYPADEAILSAKTGRMRSFFGFAPRPAPYFSPLQVGVHGAAQSALTGILAALFARDRLGAGQLVETSLLQGQFPQDLFGLVRTQLQRDFPDDFPPPAPAPARITLQYLPVMASDGRWIQFANLVEHLFHAMIAAVGLSEIYGDSPLRDRSDAGDPGGSRRAADADPRARPRAPCRRVDGGLPRERQRRGRAVRDPAAGALQRRPGRQRRGGGDGAPEAGPPPPARPARPVDGDTRRRGRPRSRWWASTRTRCWRKPRARRAQRRRAPRTVRQRPATPSMASRWSSSPP